MLDEINGRLASFLSRKLVLVVGFEALATVVLFSHLIDGGQWQTITMALAGMGVAGNALEKFTGGKK